MTDKGAEVSVIIVNWNGLSHLEVCLNSLQDQTFHDFEVVLVDNGSVDGSVAFVSEKYPWVKLVCLAENTGFATGNNRGFEQACGQYIVTLNNDTRLASDWLEQLVAVADSRPQVGMVASRICSFDEPDLLDSIGMGICRDGMARGKYRNRRWSDLQMGEVEEILIPSACAALYKRDMVAEVGFFDDDFFAYAEDVDLGLRGLLAGWDAVAATKAVVYHKYSQTSGKLSPFKVYLVERNHYWVALKTFPPGQLLLLPFFTVVRYLEQVRVVVSGGGTGGEFRSETSQWLLIKAILRASIDGLKEFRGIFSKRRQLMLKRKRSIKDFSALMKRHRISFKELLDDN